jgi:spermidine/putrescine ABC transporter ATP-binding subunit
MLANKVVMEGVERRFGQTVAVESLDLSIREGEFLTMLGPSGCGKTTTLRIIAGFVDPTAGKIFLDGREIVGIPPNRREVGMVFQNYALFPHLNVADNIAFSLKQRRVSAEKRSARVKELLQLVKMEGFESRFPAELSGGQRQRIAIARAIAHPPKILLMDEPLGALDLKLREEMQQELRALQRTLKITTLYVTHDQTEAMAMSDRIVVMNKGRVEQVGTPKDIYQRPASRFVASFVGKINIVAIGKLRSLMMRDVVLPPSWKGASALSVLGLRPESISFASEEFLRNDTNVVKGSVRDVVFLGNHAKIIVTLDPETIMELAVPVTSSIPSCGDDVRLCWKSDHAIVFD